jgi:hypothetical protein
MGGIVGLLGMHPGLKMLSYTTALKEFLIMGRNGVGVLELSHRSGAGNKTDGLKITVG